MPRLSTRSSISESSLESACLGCGAAFDRTYPDLTTSKMDLWDCSVMSASVLSLSWLTGAAGWSVSATMLQEVWGKAHTLRAVPGLGYTLQSVLTTVYHSGVNYL